MSSDSELDLHRTKLQDLVGKIREPLEDDFDEDIMGGNMDDLPSLLNKKKAKKKKTIAVVASPPPQTKRAPTVSGTVTSEQKKQRLLGSGSGGDALKEKEAPEKNVPEKDVPANDAQVQTSAPVPFVFSPLVRQGQPVLTTDSVRANLRLGLPMLQGLCLPEDMKQLPSDLEGNIVEMFSHPTLVSSLIQDPSSSFSQRI